MLKRRVTIVLILGLLLGFAGSHLCIFGPESDAGAGQQRPNYRAVPWQDGVLASDSADSSGDSPSDHPAPCQTLIILPVPGGSNVAFCLN